MTVPSHIFRAYDVRGVVGQDLTPQVARDLGRAVGSHLLQRVGGADHTSRTVAVGRDCRVHSPAVACALVDGLVSTGLDVLDIGVVPTPLLYFAVHSRATAGGVMVTGSHNPPDYNGFKLMEGSNTLYGEAIQDLRRRIDEGDLVSGAGEVRREDLGTEYQDALAQAIRPAPRRMAVVVDAGNGTAGPVAAPAYRRLGHTVEELYCRMDGTFPHHHPDPSLPENLEALADRVRHLGANLGLAFDGDSDRLGVVDAAGRVVAADRLLALLARPVLAEHPGGVVIGEVKCSQVLFDDLRRHGGQPVMGPVGHSLVKAELKRRGAILAGELSGHLFFADRWYGFDDAIYAGARVLELLASSPTPLDARLADLPATHATPELRVACADDAKFAVVDAVRASLSADHEVVLVDGVRVSFDGGWGLVRASNTEPALVLRAEADSAERLTEIRRTLESTLASVMGS